MKPVIAILKWKRWSIKRDMKRPGRKKSKKQKNN